MGRATLLLVVVFAAGCATTDPAMQRVGAFELTASSGVGAFAGGGGTVNQATVRWRPKSAWYLEGAGQMGAVLPGLFAPDDTLFLALALGGGYRTEVGGWVPRVGLRVAHIHHATFASWSATPGANLAGDSSGGVQHRTGLELTGGVRTRTLNRLGNWGVYLDVELMAGWLPSSEPMAWQGGLLVGIGLHDFVE